MKYMIIFILIASTLCYPPNRIFVGLKYISKFNGISSDGIEFEKSYYISQYLKATPLNARNSCRSYGNGNMDLVSFETREEFLKIRPKLTAEIGVDPVIIGGFAHKLNNKFDYYWMSTGTKIDYPFDEIRGEKCLALQNEGAVAYVRIKCDGNYLFICQDVEYQYAN